MKWQALCVAAMAMLFVGAGGADDASKADLKKMAGTWKCTGVEVEGKKLSADEVAKFDIQIVIKDKEYTLSKGGMEAGKGKIKLDATKKLREIDTEGTSGEGEGKTMKGIYELDGDTMKVCFAHEGARPTSFAPKEGTKDINLTYKKVK